MAHRSPLLLLLCLLSLCTFSCLVLAYKFKLPPNHFDPSAPKKNPNPPSPEVVKERNARRFPGEFFPEGYDVGEPAVTGTASSHVKWISPAGLKAKNEKRIWYDPDNPGFRPPGTFLLNMLVMNEEKHLTRTLPHWAGVIDYWIIGVDEKNTDNSEEIIKKYLGHLPGMIAEVRGFDGHGPTWTTLVSLSIEYFPGATHGIISDADFKPLQQTLDRTKLDIRCSKHMYTIRSSDHRNDRRMDWVYRNIPGARISRRTHQVIEVPVQPEQEVFQTLLPFIVDEQPGGYGDRSGNKEERYIKWMEGDLADFPDDPRALYYLGYGNLDLFHSLGGERVLDGSGSTDQATKTKALHALDQSIIYFDRRINLPPAVGNKEERWFATLKLAEIHERYKNNWAKAESYYKRCMETDPVRADPFFYVGQHYRLVSDYTTAEPYLWDASQMTAPERSLFMWYHLYNCLSKLEYARNWSQMSKPSLKYTKRAVTLLKRADCSSEPSSHSEAKAKLEQAEKTLKQLRKAAKKRKAEKARAREEAAEAEEEEQQRAKERELEKKAKKLEQQEQEEEKKSPAKKDASDPARPSSEVDPAEKVESDEKIGTARQGLRSLVQRIDALDEIVKKQVDVTPAGKEDTKTEELVSFYSSLVVAANDLEAYLDGFAAIKGKKKQAVKKRAAYLTCKAYRLATTPYLQAFQSNKQLLESVAADSLTKWTALFDSLRALCR